MPRKKFSPAKHDYRKVKNRRGTQHCYYIHTENIFSPIVYYGNNTVPYRKYANKNAIFFDHYYGICGAVARTENKTNIREIFFVKTKRKKKS